MSITVINIATSVTVNAADAVAALTAAGYTVTAPAATPAPAPAPTPAPTPAPVAGTAPVLKTVMAQNGATPHLPQDYSYNATNQRNASGGNGNPYCIEVTTTGPWGGFQPSSNNGESLSFASSSRLTVDVRAPAGKTFSTQFLLAGDLPIEDAAGNQLSYEFTKTHDGWETFSCPKAQLMTDAKKGDISATIYKGAVQYKGTDAGFKFGVDNFGGV